MPPLWGWKIFFKHAIPTGLVEEYPSSHAGGYEKRDSLIFVAAAIRRQRLVRRLTPAATKNGIALSS